MEEPSLRIDPETLLAHIGWMRRMARSLVLDPNRADDMVQQTLLAALEKRPVARGNLTAWLARAVRNTARQMGRSEGRLKRREERASGAEELPSTAELAGEAELQRLVIEAVLDLDEPYVSTVLLRYWRDLSPSQIARRDGVPTSTVRSRLQRGLSQVRERLDREFHGDRGAWSALLLPLALPEMTAKTTMGLVSATATGILAMSVKFKVALVSVCLLSIFGFLWATRTPVSDMELGLPGREADVAEPPATELEDPSRLETSVREDIPGAENDAILLKDHPVQVCIEDVVGKPVPNVTVSFAARENGLPLAGSPVTSDSKGRCTLPFPPGPSQVFLSLEADGFTPLATYWRLTPLVTITLRPTTALDVLVLAADTGAPVVGAAVEIRIRRSPVTVITGVTDQSGESLCEDVPVGEDLTVVVRASGFPVSWYSISVPSQHQGAVTLYLDPGLPLVGEVIDLVTFEPIPGAVISYRGQDLATTDSSGHFVAFLAPLQGGATRYKLLARAIGYCALTVAYSPGQTLEGGRLGIPLPRSALVTGTVKNERGDPVPGARVSPVAERSLPLIRAKEAVVEESSYIHSLPDSWLLSRFNNENSCTDTNGMFALEDLLPYAGDLRLSVNCTGYGPALTEPIQFSGPGDSATMHIQLSTGATIAGLVRLNGATVAAEVTWKGASLSGKQWAPHGRYQFTSVEAGRITVDATPDDFAYSEAAFGGAPAIMEVVPGTTVEHDLNLTLPLSNITGRVVTVDGDPAGGEMVHAMPEGKGDRARRELRTATTDENGIFELSVPDDLQEYFVSLGYLVPPKERGKTGRFFRRAVSPGSKEIVFVRPEPDPKGTLRIRVRDRETGKLVRRTDIFMRDLDERAYKPYVMADSGLFGPIPVFEMGEWLVFDNLDIGPMSVLIRSDSQGYAPAILPRVLIGGDPGDGKVDVWLERGAELRLQLAEDSDRIPGGVVAYLVEAHLWNDLKFGKKGSGEGRISKVPEELGMAYSDRRVTFDAKGEIVFRGLSPGTFRLKVYPGTAIFDPDEFTVHQETSNEVMVRFRNE